MSTFEVEIKFRVDNVAELERKLQQFSDTGFGKPVTEFDSFFQHPCRNFVQTDECLRLRKRVLPDGASEHSLTYKGPKVDSNTKTRREIEITVAEPEQWESLLTALGFHKSATVEKFRKRQRLTMNHRPVDIVLDTLPALPESDRLFVEMETMATEEEVDECRILILDLAEQLGLNDPIQDSYLKLVQQCRVVRGDEKNKNEQEGRVSPQTSLPKDRHSGESRNLEKNV
jgi:adenylate cyclase class 2